MKADGGTRGLSFQHAVEPRDPNSVPGGCEIGGRSCTQPAELEVVAVALRARRLSCRDHVGWFMLGVAPAGRRGIFTVRQLAAPTGK